MERSRPRGEGGHEDVRCRWLVAERRMWSDGVVVPAPTLDDDLGFSRGVEDLAVELFVAQAGIEALHIAVLPRTARFDIRRLGAHSGDSFLKRLGHELGAIIGSDVARNTSQDEQIGQERR